MADVGVVEGAASELQSLRTELATLLGPIAPREGVTANDQWIAKVAALVADREALLREIKCREGELEGMEYLLATERVRVGVLEGALREARDFIAYPGLVAPDSFAEDRRRELLAKLTDFAGGEAGKEKP